MQTNTPYFKEMFKNFESSSEDSLLFSILDWLQPAVIITDNSGNILYNNKQYEKNKKSSKEQEIVDLLVEVLFQDNEFSKNMRGNQGIDSKLLRLKKININLLVQVYPLIEGDNRIGSIISYININELSGLNKAAVYYDDFFVEEEAKDQEPLPEPFGNIIGNSRRIYEVKHIAAKISGSDITVLLTGESGVGKELFAEAIHKCSNRCNGPLVKTNCAAIPEALLESELFGYDGGAFTGAKAGGKKGKFEIADGGTIFLDEIGDMGMSMQTKLLRVLQEREIERVGSNKVRKIDVRIIAATNKNICKMVREENFREDLYYRLAVVNLKIPPLRERKEDVLLLVDYFLKKFNRANDKSIFCTKEAMNILENYFWRGNVRELQNVLEQAFVLCRGEIIRPSDLPEQLLSHRMQSSRIKIGSGKTLEDIMEETEKEVLESVLRMVNNNRTNAMRILGVSRRTLYKKLNKYNINNIIK
jgi:transcriptional regulator with PAS, ATPase and Fis domain